MNEKKKKKILEDEREEEYLKVKEKRKRLFESGIKFEKEYLKVKEKKKNRVGKSKKNT